MPSINRIRVNNVKYNFGTQQYDDFTMRMYGKNTLYDLANGGGKSILMLLLLQNLIPNCTLDEKQPVEKLFRAGGGNTVIHSLIEWKLDAIDVNGITVSQVMGCGAQRGYKKLVRGTEVDVVMQPKIKFEIVVSSEEWEKKTIEAIQKAAYTGEVGDGKIFSYEIRTATKIRTKESGYDALN